MSTLRVTTIQSAAGSQGVTQDRLYRGAATAWVNFSGTGTTATNQTVRDSYNVSSVFKNGTGDYTVNFSNSLSNTNYSVIGTTAVESAAVTGRCLNIPNHLTNLQTGSVRVWNMTGGAANNVDSNLVFVAIFGGY